MNKLHENHAKNSGTNHFPFAILCAISSDAELITFYDIEYDDSISGAFFDFDDDFF